jgi:hypothetical protein
MKSTFAKLQIVLISISMLGLMIAQMNELISLNTKFLSALLVFGLARIIQVLNKEFGLEMLSEDA